jgi:3-hydroxyacyl-[acyl-carrier-protein] dehydratase
MNELLLGIDAAALDAVTCDETGFFSRRYCFNDRFAGFSGHFPGYPILPAIVAILTVVSLAGVQYGAPQRLIAVEDAKFLAPIRPNTEVLVECRRKNVRGRILHEAKLTVGGTSASSFLLELSGAEEEQ